MEFRQALFSCIQYTLYTLYIVAYTVMCEDGQKFLNRFTSAHWEKKWDISVLYPIDAIFNPDKIMLFEI